MLPQLPLLLRLFAAVSVDAEVTWHAPPGCPDRAAFLAAVERRLGRPFVGGEAHVDGHVSGNGRRGYTLRLVLTVGSRAEARDIDDRSCEALADAAALRVVAALASARSVVPTPPTEPGPVAVEPGAEPGAAIAPATGPGPLAVEPATGPADAAVVTAPRRPTAPSPPPGQNHETGSYMHVQKNMSKWPGYLLRLHGGGEVGALPGPTGLVGLAAGLLWPRVRLELHGLGLVPQTVELPASAVRAGLVAGGVQGCGRLGRGALEVPLCVGLEIGAMRGEAARLPGARPATAWWVATALGPGLVWHAGARIGVWAGLQLVLAPVRPRFEQGAGQDADPLFTPAVASGRLVVGVELRLRDRW